MNHDSENNSNKSTNPICANLNAILVGRQLSLLSVPISSTELPATYLQSLLTSRLKIPDNAIRLYKVNESNVSALDPRFAQTVQTLTSTPDFDPSSAIDVTLCESIFGSIMDNFLPEQLWTTGTEVILLAILRQLEFEDSIIAEQKRLQLLRTSLNHNIQKQKQLSHTPYIPRTPPHQTNQEPVGRHEQQFLMYQQNHLATPLKKSASANSLKSLRPKSSPLSQTPLINSNPQQIQQLSPPPSKTDPPFPVDHVKPVIQKQDFQYQHRQHFIAPELEHTENYFKYMESQSTWPTLHPTLQKSYQGDKDSTILYFLETNLDGITDTFNPFHIAANYNFHDLVGRLMEKYSQFLNTTDIHGVSALQLVARQGNLETLSELVKYGAQDTLFSAISVAHMAVLSNNPIKVLEYWYGLGHAPSTTTSVSELHYAVCSPNAKEVLEWYFNRQRSFNVYTETGESLLHTAAAVGNLEAVKYLCDGVKVDVNYVTKNGHTAVHYAASVKSETAPEIITQVVRCGAQINARDCDGLTALAVSVVENAVENISALVESGADMLMSYSRDGGNNIEPGFSILHLAISEGCLLSTCALVSNVREILLMKEPKNGFTALHFAVVNRRPDIIRHLSTTLIGIDAQNEFRLELLTAKDQRGCCAIHIAVFDEYEEEITALMEMGASLNSVFVDGRDESATKMNVVELAEVYGKLGSLRVLKKIAETTGINLHMFDNIDLSVDVTSAEPKSTSSLSKSLQNSVQRVLAWTAASSGPKRTFSVQSDSESEEVQMHRVFDSMDEGSGLEDEYDLMQIDPTPRIATQQVNSGNSSPNPIFAIANGAKKMKKVKSKDEEKRTPICKHCRLPRTRDNHYVERRGVFHCLDENIIPAPHALPYVENMRLERKIQQEVKLQMEQKLKQVTSTLTPANGAIESEGLDQVSNHTQQVTANDGSAMNGGTVESNGLISNGASGKGTQLTYGVVL
ncbi:hypothetical protein HK098_002514 [Nowakowskiella sp. JEL0407]|nr:hypothetical protein HK098_002514 [Nowakowskiella sp. JEL0407]